MFIASFIFGIDLSTLIYLANFPVFMISIIIIIETKEYFRLKDSFILIFLIIAGTMIGAHILHILDTQYLLLILGIILICATMLTLLKIQFNTMFSTFLIFFSGIISGISGTGGPFTALGIKTIYKKTNTFRLWISLCAVVSTATKLVQYQAQNTFDIADYIIYWPIIPLVLLSSAVGIKIKNKMSNKSFSNYTSYVILIAGVLFLVKGIIQLLNN